MFKACLITCMMTIGCCFYASAAGSNFAVLDIPTSARLNALGGTNVALRDGDLSFALQNPALLCPQTDKMIQLGYAFIGQGLHFATALYGHNFSDNVKLEKDNPEIEKNNYFGVGLHYLDYGKMQYADEFGNQDINLTFSAKDICIDIMYARQLGEMFSVGVSLRPVYSIYEAYSSFSLGADIGGHFQTRDKQFQLGLSLQNIGWQLKGFYTDENGTQHREMLPINLALGLNYKFGHAPIRLHMTIHNMQTWAINYSMNGKETYVLKTKKGMTTDEWKLAQDNGAVMWYDMAFRHCIFGLDIVPKSERFYLSLSYNHRRRMEMRDNIDKMSLAGFALGAGIKIKMVQLGFGMSQFARNNFTYQVTLQMDINQMLK